MLHKNKENHKIQPCAFYVLNTETNNERNTIVKMKYNLLFIPVLLKCNYGRIFISNLMEFVSSSKVGV